MMEKSGKMECIKCGSTNVSVEDSDAGTVVVCKACGHKEQF